MTWLDENVLYIILAGFVAVLVLSVLHGREYRRRRGREPRARLMLPDEPELEIVGEDHLRDALKQLSRVSNGQSVRLAETPSHYLEAVREGEFWSASLNTGRAWTSMQFTAGMTSEYSDREVKARRHAGSVWKQLTFRPTQPERALSTRQVEELFASYLLGREYPVPTAGAG
jgi:hypothetical protein